MARPAHWEPAIVVGSADFGDADRIVRLLTPEQGRVSALARGARRSTKRFGGALDLGNRIDAALRPGSGSLSHLDEASLVDGRLGARADLGRLTLLLYACELCAALAREHHPEPRLFGLLDTASLLLAALTGPPGDLFRLALEAKALTFAGVGPALDRCGVCEGPLEDPMVWSPTGGGALHLRCHAGEAQRVSVDWLLAVSDGRRAPLRDRVDAVLPPGPREALAEAIEAHTGHPLRARRMLAELASSG